MKREEELTVSEQLAEALDHIKRLIVALKPFSDFAINVEFDGDLNTNAWKSSIHRESISTWFGPSDFAYAAFAVGDTSGRLSSLAAPKMETVWIQNLKGFINGVFPSDDLWKRIFIDQLERIDQAPAPKPKPKPVGWETEAEWELEMRCANLTENTPFAEVSKLINDLWQQYCLAAEPKPEAEGVDRQVHHSNPVASQNTQIVERDIYEVANQLGGYVGPDTPERLKRFLLKEEKAAAALADEIVRLRSELANARNKALEESAKLIEEGFDRPGIAKKQDTCAHGKFGWEDCEKCAVVAIRDLKAEGGSR